MLCDTSIRSPNFDAGRGGERVRLILLHATVGDLQSSLDWFQNPKSKVSSHYVISKSGHIYQVVDEANTAWHAGRAKWQGFTNINTISIGIELENANDGHDPYPAPQVTALTTLVRDILDRYHLTPAAIARHLDVAVPAGRKSDPAGFPFKNWRASLVEAIYQVVGVPIYQRQNRTGPVAGHLAVGEQVQVDVVYPDGGGHLADGRGFVDMQALK